MTDREIIELARRYEPNNESLTDDERGLFAAIRVFNYRGIEDEALEAAEASVRSRRPEGVYVRTTFRPMRPTIPELVTALSVRHPELARRLDEWGYAGTEASRAVAGVS